MKTVAIATTLLAIFLALAPSECGGTKTKTVSAATIAKLPPGQTFEANLTRKGTVYHFKDANTDFSRVTIRTASGVEKFSELLKASNMRPRGGLLLGTPANMRTRLVGSTGGTTHYTCGIFCNCDGADDCTRLLLDDKCDVKYFWCDDKTGHCICIPKPS